jgi:xyloglucan-specific exo-beta-1,4-glucanase
LISPTGGVPLISGFGDIAGFAHDRLDVSPPHMHLNPFLPNTNNLDYAALAPEVVVRSGSIQSRQAEQDVTLAWSADGGRSWQPLRVPPIGVGGAPPRRYDLKGEAPIVVSADGQTFAVSTPVAMLSDDRGGSWHAAGGLPVGTRIVSDKAAAGVFYAVDFAQSRLFVSRDHGKTFAPAAARGLPPFNSAAPRDRESPPALVAAPGAAGELWFLVDGRLYRSRDSGRSFAPASSPQITIHLFGLGKRAPGGSAPALYAFGSKDSLAALWRSTDGGATWARINDDEHQWGLLFHAITGDPRKFGRVYVATFGRGILYGDPLP